MCDNFQQQKKQEAINMAENKTKPVQIRMTEAQYEAIPPPVSPMNADFEYEPIHDFFSNE